MNNDIVIHHEDRKDHQPFLQAPDPHQDAFTKNTLGFWLYLMTDCLIFATLFCAYAVLHPNTFGGPSGKDIFRLSTAFSETMILLMSSLTCGFSILAFLKNKKTQVLFWLICSALFGLSFLALELHEFAELIAEGYNWQRSAFLSAFFTLVGTHGLHVSFGLLWMSIIIAQIFYFGIESLTFRRLTIFSLFWHFLDLIWIFIFTFVYLLGVI